MSAPPTPNQETAPVIAVTGESTPSRTESPAIPQIAVFGGSTENLDANGEPYQPPPSPTPSQSSTGSVHWASSVALRDNAPGNGLSSLHLLAAPTSHRRRGSSATTASTGSETVAGDHAQDVPLSPKSGHSTLGSPTATHVDDDADLSRSPSRSTDGGKGKGKHRFSRPNSPSLSPSPSPRPSSDGRRSSSESASGRGDRQEEEGVEMDSKRPAQAALEDEEDGEPAPFRFKPRVLANLVDPKSLEALDELGGVDGLLSGLGTRADSGLSSSPGRSSEHRTSSEHTAAASDMAKRPSITINDGEPDENDVASFRAGTSNAHYNQHASDSADPFGADMDERARVYGHNVLPARASKSLLRLMWDALTDRVLILLSVAAVVSLALGFFQDFGPARDPDQPPVDWVEGVAIIVAIMVVVLVGSLNDWQKERQFQVLNAKKEDRAVKVIRDGEERLIGVHDVVVGDIALLEPGEVVPCDGVFLSGHNVKCDESGATGESDAIRKVSYAECQELLNRKRSEKGKSAEGKRALELMGHTDCFVVSGSRVLEGVGRYVVIAVGTKSFNGRIMMALRGDAEDTPLQGKLNRLADLIAWAGMIAGLVLFVGLMIRFFVELGTGVPVMTPAQKGIVFVNILIISVTLVVVAVPEGLPLAVTIALAFATKRMTRERLLVRVLGSCETMANATVVCTDKTGTLTQNEMTVVAGSVGIHAKFVRDLANNGGRADTEASSKPGSPSTEAQRPRRFADDFPLELSDLDQVLSPALREAFNESIACNSTAFEDTDPENGTRIFVGSKTETALLKMAVDLKWDNYRKTREGKEQLQVVPFSSERKAMGVVVRHGRGARFYVKGASEILVDRCTSHVVVSKPGEGKNGNDEIETDGLSGDDKENVSRTITFYAGQSLRTIAICYRDFEQWPPAEVTVGEDGEVPYDFLASELVLISITGIEDPLRQGVRGAVADCSRAGVQVKMCTGDNVLTARSIARQCGIYTPGGIVMEGPVFRSLPPNVQEQVVPRLQVLARSSPEDKRVLVDTLKRLGEVVGVTGDGTNDGPALKTADVGFSMGIAGTEVAKEASDIILMDDNFASIVKAIMWGRAVNDAVRKFLQFQISTNVTAVVITIVSGLASSDEVSVLTAVQLLWINIIMDTFAALALATDPATTASLDRKPDRKWAPLFSCDMLKQILGQSAYQCIIILIFHFLGAKILGFGGDETDKRVTTLVFNAFVFAQIFNSFNCRSLDRRFNIFEGMTRNWWFIGITLIEIGAQILIVFIGGAAFSVTRIAGREWGISLALGFVSIPLGALIRLIPNGPCERLFRAVRLLPRDPSPLPTTAPGTPEPGLGFALDMLRNNLGTFQRVRGGRVRSSSFVVRSMNAAGIAPQKKPRNIIAATMLPSLLGANLVGANWTPHGGQGSLSDPAGFDPSRSAAQLWETKVEVHPDTPEDDPVFKIFPGARHAEQ